MKKDIHIQLNFDKTVQIFIFRATCVTTSNRQKTVRD